MESSFEKSFSCKTEDLPKDALTDLADGTRVMKDDLRMDICGTLDELSSHIGLLLVDCPAALTAELQYVQRKLFAIGAYVAGARDLPGLPTSEDVQVLKRRIAEWGHSCGAFDGFILPGGCRAAAQSHVCRTVCRRAERCVVTLRIGVVLPYLNRLSTYFFYLSKYLNKISGVEEIKI